MPKPTPGATLSPVDEGFVARVSRGLRYMIAGDPNAFFGPGQPLPPAAQDQAAGRQFDYPVAYNLNIRPRSYEAIDFPTLRALADNYDLVRLAVETRKDQMGKMAWCVQRVDGEDLDPAGQAIQDFLQEPDQEHDFGTWLRMLLEDLLVIDAPTVYVHRTKGGQPFSFDPIDGATIARKLDQRGRTPIGNQPAYQQIIKGLPAVDYTRDELIYLPRNQRTQKVYGFSPVEQILMLVNIGLRRETFQLQYYTDGNVPDMLLETPQGWSANQIAEFQKLFDEVLAGDQAARRRVRFIPNGAKGQMLKTEPLFDVFDEWLARVVCYAFSLPPTAFVKQQNRATATTAEEVALSEGLAPLMEWVTRFMTRVIRAGWNTRDYVFAWQDEQDVDPMVQAQVDQIYLGGATGQGRLVRSVAEVRDDHGWGPAPPEVEEANAPAPPPVIAPAAPDGSEAPGDPTPELPAATKLVKRRSLRPHRPAY